MYDNIFNSRIVVIHNLKATFYLLTCCYVFMTASIKFVASFQSPSNEAGLTFFPYLCSNYVFYRVPPISRCLVRR